MSDMSLKKFVKEMLPGYANVTNARRALGKCHLEDADKDKANTAIDKHFGAEPAKKAVKKTAKKPAKKPAKKAVKNSTKEVKKGRKKVVKKKATKKTTGRGPGRPRKVSPTEPRAKAAPEAVINALGEESAIAARINLLGSVVANAVAGIQALDFGNKMSSGNLSIQEGVQGAGAAITNAMKELGSISTKLSPVSPVSPVEDTIDIESVLGADPETVHSTPEAVANFANLVKSSDDVDEDPDSSEGLLEEAEE